MAETKTVAFAHSGPGEPGAHWHTLEAHLQAVSNLAARFAGQWNGGGVAGLAGLWHDLGKYAPDWQAFLREVGADAPAADADPEDGPNRRRRGPDHSTAGAIHAMEKLMEDPRAAQLVAFVIAGHHAGLSDWQDLRVRLDRPEKRNRYKSVIDCAESVIVAPSIGSLPSWIRSLPKDDAERRELCRSFEFLVRMSFSALIDADRLDTEAFVEVHQPVGRSADRCRWRSLTDYEPVLDAHLAKFSVSAVTPINEQRRRVLEWCRGAASGARGAYSLTVPTGGGKTLSSLAFALRHASIHGHARVVVALPFLSVLDQTADVYRGIFKSVLGDPALVEHHSNIAPERDTRANLLATENWDAPLIVTTQVQLFESLFSNRPGACRKLHNLSNSVVILDEVQSLPAGLLNPILEALQQLRTNYGTTLLLMTATQPSLHRRAIGSSPSPRPWLDPAPTEIIPDGEIPGLFAAMERVRVEWPASEEPTTWPTLAGALARERQVLAIVHRRADARDLWQEVEALAPGVIHLSALMCPAHRRKVLGTIRSSLQSGLECRVVSTQLVEAGVDLDFPVVFRAMAGLEALAQSAGRCNREGRLPVHGRFIVYHPSTAPPQMLQHHSEIARIMLRANPNLSLTSPETFREYFERLYSIADTDSKGVQALREAFRFQEIARRFHLIDDATTTVFVPWGSAGRSAIEEVRRAGPSKDRLRKLQPFGVSVFPQTLSELRSRGRIEQLHETVICLVSEQDYHPIFGLDLRPEDFRAHIA